jgi:hypothetical protein
MTGAIVGDFAKWLGATPLSHAIQTAGWVIPALQTIHILGIAVLFFSAVIVDLRLWGVLQRDAGLGEVARRFLPVIWPTVLVLFITGSFLIIGEPRRSLLNTTFYLKMTLLVFALIVTAVLQWSLWVTPDFWEKGRNRCIAARCAATLSIALWCCIIFAGRWIAYTQVG